MTCDSSNNKREKKKISDIVIRMLRRIERERERKSVTTLTIVSMT